MTYRICIRPSPLRRALHRPCHAFNSRASTPRSLLSISVSQIFKSAFIIAHVKWWEKDRLLANGLIYLQIALRWVYESNEDREAIRAFIIVVHEFAAQERDNYHPQCPQIHLRSLFDPHRLSDPLLYFASFIPPASYGPIFRYISSNHSWPFVSILCLDPLGPAQLIRRACSELCTVATS